MAHRPDYEGNFVHKDVHVDREVYVEPDGDRVIHEQVLVDRVIHLDADGNRQPAG